jgi:hypothetical protein
MGISFLSPLAALIVLAGVLPLAALALVRRRARGVRKVLGLPEPGRAERLEVPVAIGAVAVLIALAAAQPTIRNRQWASVRTDAEIWVVLDTSRSMLARRAPDLPSRLQRAKAFAARVRVALPGIRVGIASFTDRVLPDLFPSPDVDAFEATLRGAVGIERPPPSQFLRTRVSTLIPLTDLRTANFFAPEDARRIAIVLTDGESQPFSPEKVGAELAAPPRIDTILVQLWHPGERVYSNGQLEAAYRPDPTSGTTLKALAAAAGGVAYGETRPDAVVAAARDALGDGPVTRIGEERGETRLAPWVSLAALLPLSFVLWRRNLR